MLCVMREIAMSEFDHIGTLADRIVSNLAPAVAKAKREAGCALAAAVTDPIHHDDLRTFERAAERHQIEEGRIARWDRLKQIGLVK